MTDLHWALLGLGALIIGAVLAFNWWQERKFKQETSKRFDEPQFDALMEEARTIRNEEFHIDHHAVQDADDDTYQPAQEVEQPPHATEYPEEETPQAPYAENDYADEVIASPEFETEDNLEASEPPTWEEEAVVPEEIAPEGIEAEPVSSNQYPENVVITLPAEVNPDIDFVATLSLSQPATGHALREFLLSITDIDKPVYAYGLGGDKRWYLLTREQESASFSAAICSLQLADRSGAVSTGTLSRFHLAVEELAQSLGADIEWLNTDNPLQQAKELDQFCIEVDQMVGFHLTQGASGPFTGTKFRGLAEAGGLRLGEDGAYHYIAEEEGSSHVLFSVVNHDNLPFNPEMLRTSVIRGLTFQLDIPRVRSYAEAYNHMVLLARQMEHSLGAHLVDDKQRELSDAQIDKIRQQIKPIHDKILAHGIVPGEAYALRLFS